MVLGQRDSHEELLARAAGRAFEPLGAELRLVDPGHFIAYIHDENLANIQDIVESSAELFFKPGTIAFGWGAAYELEWNSKPAVTLDMEFRHHHVWLVFKLILRAARADVKIEHFSTGESSCEAGQSAAALAKALASARLNGGGA